LSTWLGHVHPASTYWYLSAPGADGHRRAAARHLPRRPSRKLILKSAMSALAPTLQAVFTDRLIRQRAPALWPAIGPFSQYVAMAWEWLGPVTTTVVALAGLGTNIVISAFAQRTQRALLAAGHELQAENARRLERREAYTRFLSGHRRMESVPGSSRTANPRIAGAWERLGR
jgi:hypothetical protein